MRRILANLLYVLAAIMIVFMVYSMIKGTVNYRYGAIAIVIALLAKGAERLQG